MTIELTAETRRKLIGSIRRYGEENLAEEFGDLKAGLLLDYCLEEIGPAVYNQAIADARAFMTDRLADLEAACYETEMRYWPEQDRRSG